MINLRITETPTEDSIKGICDLYGWTRAEYDNLLISYTALFVTHFEKLGYKIEVANENKLTKEIVKQDIDL